MPVVDPTIALLIAPGSFGGSRPKANYRGVDGDLWIAKFPSRTDRRDSGAWELVVARLARNAGIDVADTDLLTLGGGGRTFVTRRFDLTAEGRRPFASAMTMTGKRDGEPAGYPDLAQAVADHVAHNAVREDLEQLFRRLVFNILAGNRDDHLRNHGFVRLPEGWRLAPAYDLNPAREMAQHSLAIDGRTTTPSLTAALATRGCTSFSEPHAQRHSSARSPSPCPRGEMWPESFTSRESSRPRLAPCLSLTPDLEPAPYGPHCRIAAQRGGGDHSPEREGFLSSGLRCPAADVRTRAVVRRFVPRRRSPGRTVRALRTGGHSSLR